MSVRNFTNFKKSHNFISSFSLSALAFVSFSSFSVQSSYAAGPANVTGGNVTGPGPASGGPSGAGAGASMGGGSRGGSGGSNSTGGASGSTGNGSGGGSASNGSGGGSASNGSGGGSAGNGSGGGSAGNGSGGGAAGAAAGGSVDGGGGAPAGWIPAWVPAGWAPASGWAAAAQSGQQNAAQGQAANNGGDGASPFVEILNVEFEVRPRAGFEPKCPVLLQILEESFRNSRARENKAVGEAPLVWLADSFVLRHTSRNIAVWRAVLKPTFAGCEGEAVISAIDGAPYRAKNSHLKLFFRRGFVFLAVDVSKVGKNSVITARKVTDGGVPVWSWLDTSS